MVNFYILLTSIFSACLTYYISEKRKKGAIRASALPSLIIGLLFYIFKDHIDPIYQRQIPATYLGASFVGMVSAGTLTHIRLVGFAGLLFGLIFVYASHFFQGYGGALGTSASIAVMASMCVPILMPRRKTLTNLLLLRKWFAKQKRKMG